MQFYLYAYQDLILHSSSNINISAGSVCRLKLDQDETIEVFPTNSAGVLMLNQQILTKQSHNKIIFHKLNEDAILCEIKPFVVNENIKQYTIRGGIVKLVENIGTTYIYHNSNYCGHIKDGCGDITFDKHENNSREYGIIKFGENKKHIILFNDQKIIYCGEYVDSETTNKYIQIYSHKPNMFNTGQLIKYSFKNEQLETKAVCDRGDERKQINAEFNAIYFLEAIKCGRYKYAHSKLSYELRAIIDVDILNKYFKQMDEYIYLQEQDVYIALKNNKVIGTYHLVVKDNLIDNIY